MKIDDLKVGDALPVREHTPSNVSLFLYNAAVWNAHRIHYDERYTTQVEKHPGVVIDGPLQGDWLAQCVTNWLTASFEGAQLLRFRYSNRRATYLGESLRATGCVTGIDRARAEVAVELWVENAAGRTTLGSAVVRIPN